MSEIGLTVLIPCKNERGNIRDCVASARQVADEILIADSGSTDGTLEMVRAMADCRVIEREFVNSGDFKNWAIPQASQSWVFVLDADERITPELADELRNCLRADASYDGYWVYRVNHFMGHRVRYTCWGRDKVIRLVRKELGRYTLYTDHAEMDLDRGRVGKLRSRLTHFTCWDFDTYLAKMMRYTEQQAELWYRQGRRPSVFKLVVNGPLRFLRSYVFDRGALDGRVGFQIAVLTGFYSFLKQARLWHKYYGRSPGDVDTLPQGSTSPAPAMKRLTVGPRAEPARSP